VKSDDELAAVLAHEIGHVAAKHSMKNMQHQVAYNIILNRVKKRVSSDAATVGTVYATFANLRYSRKNEMEADQYGARYAALAGYNPRGMINFLKVLQSLHPDDPSRIEVSLRSHPPTERRIEAMNSYLAGFPPEVQQRPVVLSHKVPFTVRSEKKALGERRELSSAEPAIIWSSDFNQDGGSGKGIAKKWLLSREGAGFSVDSTVSLTGSSQKMTNWFEVRSAGLVTEPIVVRPGTDYSFEIFVKPKGVTGKGDLSGRGVCFYINELSQGRFVKSHYNIGGISGSSEQFKQVKYAFRTTDATTALSIEALFCRSRGTVWLDDASLTQMHP
jgi:hypothetical protein